MEVDSQHCESQSTPGSQDDAFIFDTVTDTNSTPTLASLIPPAPPVVKKQWVKWVIEFSSEYDTTGWSHRQVIGPPRVFPDYGDNEGAWTTSYGSGYEHIIVRFKHRVRVTKIDIYETYTPGGVVRIAALVGDLKNPAEAGTAVQNTRKRKRTSTRNSAGSSVGSADVLGALPAESWVVLFEQGQAKWCTNGVARKFSPPLLHLDEGIITDTIRIDLDCASANDYVEIDAIRLHGYRVDDDKDNSQWRTPDEDAGVTQPTPFGASFAQLVCAPAFADLQLILDDGSRVPVHRNILASRSEVFRAMLTGGMMEAGMKEVHLGDISRTVLSLLLTFLYTDAVEVPREYIVSLFVAADRFNLARLRARMVAAFCACLSETNVVDVLKRVQHLELLRSACKDFILAHYRAVASQSEFDSLPQDVLLELIRTDLMRRKK